MHSFSVCLQSNTTIAFTDWAVLLEPILYRSWHDPFPIPFSLILFLFLLFAAVL